MVADPDVHALLARYCDLVDAGDWDAVGALFAGGRLAGEDGTAFATGAAEVAAFYRRGTRLHDGSPRTKHLVLGTVIETRGDGTVEARSSYLVLQAMGGELRPIVTGRYRDTFVSEGGGWRWDERRFSVDLAGDLSQHLTWSPPT